MEFTIHRQKQDAYLWNCIYIYIYLCFRVTSRVSRATDIIYS